MMGIDQSQCLLLGLLTLAPLPLGCVRTPAPVAAPEVVASPLLGLWEAEILFSEGEVGTLNLWTQGPSPKAQLEGAALSLTVSEGDIRADSPDGSGYFRGHVSEEGEPEGHWVHPITMARNYPIAAPLNFREVEGAWSAAVPAYRDGFRFYLWVEEGEGGELQGFIRNPERNIGAWFGTFTIEVEGRAVEFIGQDGEGIMEGELELGGESPALTMSLPLGDGQVLNFKPGGAEEGDAFYPTHEKEAYVYALPEDRGDGWAVADAATVGLDPEALAQAVESIRREDVTTFRAPLIHSLLISRGGSLVLEEYFYGYGAEEPHDTRSAGKSVASMIVGSVVDRDHAFTMERTLESIFGEDFEEGHQEILDPSYEQRAQWRREMTVGHALSMQSGLDADDNNPDSLGGEDPMQNQDEEGDWLRYILGVPMVRAPGTKAIYASNSINLAGASAAKASGQWLPDVFRHNLAEPLGISNYFFNLDPSGRGYAGGGIRLTPRDFLKLGQVMLDEGQWRGEAILSAAWVEDSTSPKGSIYAPGDYGYGWWRRAIPFEEREVEVIYASGNGGQFVIIVPEFELVIQLSGGNYGMFPVWYAHLTELLPELIFPAVL